MSFRDFLLDPLTVKELSGTSRRWQTFVGRTLYLALVGFVVWEFTRMWEQRSTMLTLSDYAGLGRDLFQGFFGLQMAMVTVNAVTAASDMVTKENRAGTLGVLASTPLTPFRIALGKWKAALAQTSTLILCGAPILAVCVFLGGATAWDLCYSLALTLAAAALGAALSLYFSTIFRSGVSATLVSLALLGAFIFLPATVIKDRGSPEATVLCYLHPAYAAIAAARPRRIAAGQQYGWIGACAFTGLLVWSFLGAAARRVAKLAVRTPAPPVLTRTFEAMDRFYEGVGPEKFRKIRVFGGSDGVWQTQALLWKELRTRSSGKLRNSVRISLLLLVLSAAAIWMGLGILYALMWASAIAFFLLALSNGVGLFVTEREERKWDVLLSTPLSSREIVQAKLTAGLVPLLPTAVLLILFWICTGWISRMSPLDVLQMLMIVFLPGLLAYAVGAAASLRAASLRGAFTMAFGVMVGLIVILPFLISINAFNSLGWTARNYLLFSISPIPYLADFGDSIGHYGFSGYRSNIDISAFVIFSALYSGAIMALFLHMHASFNRITGRVSP